MGYINRVNRGQKELLTGCLIHMELLTIYVSEPPVNYSTQRLMIATGLSGVLDTAQNV